MGKTLALVLAILALASLIAAIALFFHGLWARRQMNRYKRLAEASPGKKPRLRETAAVEGRCAGVGPDR